ncbi:MAG: hypothetical protein K5872_03870 [Rhizobiaceae bacterium]|nr:hypothetical protein [Rhizobiaceae bacterium]MCV0405349.1 hypothetical protein [Rhizobiaceae bacterium]
MKKAIEGAFSFWVKRETPMGQIAGAIRGDEAISGQIRGGLPNATAVPSSAAALTGIARDA